MPREMVGNWLYGVARSDGLEGAGHNGETAGEPERSPATSVPEPHAATDPDPSRELESLLDQELGCLSDKYRVAIVLCDLEGTARKEVARQLGIPEGTLSSRLTAARKMLAKRLARHGCAGSAGTLAAALTQRASACVPPPVASSAIQAATRFAAGQAAATGAAPARVTALAEGVIKVMFWTKFRTTTAVLLVLSVSALACGVLAKGQPDADDQRAGKSAARSGHQRCSPGPGEEGPPRSRRPAHCEGHHPAGGSPPDPDRRTPLPRRTHLWASSGSSRAVRSPLGLAYGRVEIGGQTVEEAAGHDPTPPGDDFERSRVLVTRPDTMPEPKVNDIAEVLLETRVRLLEEEVRKLRTTVEKLQMQKK